MRSAPAGLGRCPGAALLSLWTAAASAGPTPGGADTDRDGVESAFDNCVAVPNPSQTDANHDGCGDACTQTLSCDANGDTAVGLTDFLILGMNFHRMVPEGTGGDCDPPGGDGIPGVLDFVRLGMELGHRVGPSSITNAQCDPSRCQCTPQ